MGDTAGVNGMAMSKTARNRKLWEIKRYHQMILDERYTQQYRLEVGYEEYQAIKEHLIDEIERIHDLFDAVKAGG